MKFKDIAPLRLKNQHLNSAPFSTPGEAVEWLVASQAQDYYGAQWALGLRMQAAVDSDLDQALTEGTILRTHVLRPTWHFVTPQDIRWLLGLTAPRVHAINAGMYRQQGLDERQLKRSQEVMAQALQGGHQLTREELRAELEQASLPANSGLRLAYIMMAAELDGVICSGGRRGKQFTYALLEERAPQARTLDREQALAELARRYFTSRGPATIQDLARWSGLTVADANLGLEAVQTQLAHEELGGQIYWFPDKPPQARTPEPAAHLLSFYDEYISGYKDRSAIAGGGRWKQLLAHGNALRYVIVLDGQIAGLWKPVSQKKSVTITCTPLWPFTAAERRAITLAAEQYAGFKGWELEIISFPE